MHQAEGSPELKKKPGKTGLWIISWFKRFD